MQACVVNDCLLVLIVQSITSTCNVQDTGAQKHALAVTGIKTT